MPFRLLKVSCAKPLLVAFVAFFGAVGASSPIAAQPFTQVLSVPGVSDWLLRFAGWLGQGGESVPPSEIGTCIDPNGKPRPCPIVNFSGPEERAKPPRGTPEV